MIESVLPKFIRSIICSRPWVPWIVPLFRPKDVNDPVIVYLFMLDGSPTACKSDHSAGKYI